MEYNFQGRNAFPQFNWAPDYGYDADMYHDDWIWSDYQGPFGMLDLNNEYQQSEIPWRGYLHNDRPDSVYDIEPSYGQGNFQGLDPHQTWGPLSGQPQFSEWDLNTGQQTMQPWDYYGPYGGRTDDESHWDFA